MSTYYPVVDMYYPKYLPSLTVILVCMYQCVFYMNVYIAFIDVYICVPECVGICMCDSVLGIVCTCTYQLKYMQCRSSWIVCPAVCLRATVLVCMCLRCTDVHL